MLSKIEHFILENFIDKNLRANYKHYIIQSVMIFICMGFVIFLSKFIDNIVVASLGASCFILFVTPHTNSSRVRYVIGGYTCGLIMGLLFSFIYIKVSGSGYAGTAIALVIVCAAAVAVTALLMVVTNSEHPPAAALALGLTTDPAALKTAVATIISVVVLCAIRHVLSKYLKNLI